MTTNAEPYIGSVLDLAVRPKEWTPMQRLHVMELTTENGIVLDYGTNKRRGITLLSQQQWQATIEELGADLPWTLRRANVLIDAPNLEPLIGQTIRLGEVTVEVLDESRPCPIMDRQHPGLSQALVPECRGGVFGRILNDGAIRVGDEVVINA